MSEFKNNVYKMQVDEYNIDTPTGLAHASYSIFDKDNNKKTVELEYPSELKYTDYIRKGGKIIDTKYKPAYGYKLVRNTFNQYMYLRTYDNAVIPYIFDIATNFNIYGLALVAKDGKISWIDNEFMYYDERGIKRDLNEDLRMDGWLSITNFRGGMTKLSKCVSDSEGIFTSFVDTYLNSKFFKQYDGKKLSERSINRFLGLLTDFDKTGYARRVKNSEEGQEELYLSSEGYFMTEDVLLQKSIEGREESIIQTALNEGILDTITDNVKQLKK